MINPGGRRTFQTFGNYLAGGWIARSTIMPRGDKSKYTGKQEHKADHIAESYEARGVPDHEAERRAWATVNKDDGGGKRPGGSGRGKSPGHPAAHNGGRQGGPAPAARATGR